MAEIKSVPDRCICPVCHQEPPAAERYDVYAVSDGDLVVGHCCSEGCAGVYEAHLKQVPEKRQPLP